MLNVTNRGEKTEGQVHRLPNWNEIKENKESITELDDLNYHKFNHMNVLNILWNNLLSHGKDSSGENKCFIKYRPLTSTRLFLKKAYN